MLKLIAILVLSSTMSVAVEKDGGYAERIFPNTSAGARQLIEFAEKTVGEPEAGVRIVVGSVNAEDDMDHILQVLSDLGIKHGFVSQNEIASAVADNKLSGPSAKAVALADEKKFGFLYREKK